MVPAGRTDADGSFRIPNLWKGTWTVQARAHSGESVQRAVEIREHDSEVGVELELRRGFLLSGTIASGDEPVWGARVQARSASDSGDDLLGGLSSTDQGGDFAIRGLRTGRYRILVSAPGILGSHEELVDVDGDLELHIELRVRELQVEVVDAESGAPLPGTRIRVARTASGASSNGSAENGLRVTTGMDGVAHLALSAKETYTLLAEHEGYRTAQARVDEEVSFFELPLERDEGVLALRLVRSSGASAGRVRLVALDPLGTIVHDRFHQPSADGTVELRGLPLGVLTFLIAEPLGAPAEISLENAREPLTSPPLIVLPAAGELRLSVREMTTRPGAAILQLFDASGRPLRHPESGGVVDRWPVHGGHLSMRNVPAGIWTARVSGPDGEVWSGIITVEAGKPVELSL
jgi:hypothetical protein